VIASNQYLENVRITARISLEDAGIQIAGNWIEPQMPEDPLPSDSCAAFETE
jgi:hypothetical protein